LREKKFVSLSGPDIPFDPDSTFEGNDDPGEQELNTDYEYDNLYRLKKVRTAGGKTIEYQYDGYSRQSQRTTVDAGVTKYIYDANNNLLYSQDANQLSRASNIYTFRSYDALNRLLSIGETQLGQPNPNFDDLVPDIEYYLDGASPGDNLFVVNVYDTLLTASLQMFYDNKPSDYYHVPNYTRGNLVATAFRTRLTDQWSAGGGFKYYRYDARGNVVRVWQKIDGLGWKTQDYYYNSQNKPITFSYNWNQSDKKVLRNTYDDAGRLNRVDIYNGFNPADPETVEDNPILYENLVKYTYNPNSQVERVWFNNEALKTIYDYNNRNWVSSYMKEGGSSQFIYGLYYLNNGNVRTSSIGGSYKDNFANQDNLYPTYTYDKSNRLVMVNSGPLNTYDLVTSYDDDGNILGLRRFGASDNLLDNFVYSYYTNTNRLQKVSGSVTQYEYDNNGNVKKDEVNKNYDLVYDHRNLLTGFGYTRAAREPRDPDNIYYTKYYYDEAGHRIRKATWKYHGSEPEPIFNEGDAITWELISNDPPRRIT
jgi:YD repeat-containing protein